MNNAIRCTAEASSDHGPGYARLILSGVAPFPGKAVKLRIERGADTNNVLGPAGWQSENCWLSADGVEIQQDKTFILVGRKITQYLRAGSNLRVTFGREGDWPEASSSVAWPAIVGMAAQAQGGRRRVSLGGGRAHPAPASATAEDSSQPQQAPSSSSPPPQPPPAESNGKARQPFASTEEELAAQLDDGNGQPRKGSSLPIVLIGVFIVLLLLSGAAGAYFFIFQGELPEFSNPLTADHSSPWGEAKVREYLGGAPNPEDSLAQAKMQQEAGHLDMAFLLYKQAASQGQAEALTALAAMYDPDLFSPTTSALPGPNLERAIELYEQAAAKNDPVALRRLGILTVEGRDGIEADPQAGKTLLEKAAAAGDSEAQAYLKGME